jgi:hypothetical protein
VIPLVFCGPGFVQNLNYSSRAEIYPDLQNQDRLIIRSHLDELGTLSIYAAGTDDCVAVGQTRGTLRIDKSIGLQQVPRFEFPNRFSLPNMY